MNRNGSESSLGRNEEERARLVGAEDARANRPINEAWLWRRDAVAAAYRDGYLTALPGCPECSE